MVPAPARYGPPNLMMRCDEEMRKMIKPSGSAVVQAAISLVGKPYDEMDCQEMVEEAVRRAGGSMSYPGSNAMARAVSGLSPLKDALKAGLEPGMALFIREDGGDYPAKYHADGLGNFSHVGLYAGEDALTDTDKYGKPRSCNVVHSSATMGRVAGSTLSNGWTHAGYFREIDYGESKAPASDLGDRILKRGDTGSDVIEMQENLMVIGYDLGRYGADGKFGAETEAAVRAFQKDADLVVDGKYGSITHKALMGVLDDIGKDEIDGTDDDHTPVAPPGKRVLVTGDNVNVRSGPATTYRALTRVDAGDTLPYVATAEDVQWHAVKINGQIGWISGKYAQIKGC